MNYPTPFSAQTSPEVWMTLITRENYLEGVLMLNYSLKKVKSKYPLVVLYTSQLDEKSLSTIHANNIPAIEINSLNPKTQPDLTFDPRFQDTWSKLSIFNLTDFKRVVQLDSDMLVIRNIDELMKIPLNNFKFASTAACVCNPLNKPHYPVNWKSENCQYVEYHVKKRDNDNHSIATELGEILGPPCHIGLSKCNSGLLVVEPSKFLFNEIIKKLNDSNATRSYTFPDQDLLADVFYNDWLCLSYIYNTFKTFPGCHPDLWNENKFKNIHYILSPKPWEVDRSYVDDSNTFKLWWDMNDERLANAEN